MTYRQIEASREARLWLGQIVIPAVTGVVALMTVPEVRDMVAVKANQIKERIKTTK